MSRSQHMVQTTEYRNASRAKRYAASCTCGWNGLARLNQWQADGDRDEHLHETSTRDTQPTLTPKDPPHAI